MRFTQPESHCSLRRRPVVSTAALAVSFLFFPAFAAAQQACPPVHIVQPNPGSDIFTDRQEMDVGDAIAEQVQREFLVIDDEDYTGYVQRIGKRLLDHAPPTDLRIQFFLFDLPVANALSLPGGRVYVSRKLVAMTRTEDELADILGHELGHVLTHQPAVHVSQLFHDVLAVTVPGTREEIFKHYQDLQDNQVRKHKAFAHAGGEDKQEQLIADQIGMQLVANSGYRIQSFPEIFDRIAETKGKTGNWLTDFFGGTSNESRRLREILKQTPSLMCGNSVAAATASEFQKWQSSVVGYAGLGHKERLQGVLAKVSLNPPLRSDIHRIRYSPDGKFLLAQDEASIFVLDGETLTPKFTIYAPDAYDAAFSPDSQSIVFYNPSLRVEAWSVADEMRSSASEVVISRGCLQKLLSPDGRYIACYGNEFDLALYDVRDNAQVFQKRNFYEPGFGDLFLIFFARILGGNSIPILHIGFSPDGHYLVAHSPRDECLAINLDGFHALALPGSVKALLSREFAFIGSDKIVGVDPSNQKNSGIVRFPSGESVQKLKLGAQSLEAASNPRYLFLRPIQGYAVGVLDLNSEKFVLATDKPATDIYGDNYVRERIDGDIGVFKVNKEHDEGRRVKLPLGELGNLQAFSVSPDLHWLAISGKTRGAVWNLTNNQRLFYIRGFKGSVINNQGVADVDIQKFEKTNRHLVRLDTSTKYVAEEMDLDKTEGTQFGTVFLRSKRNGKNEWKWRDVLMEALDVHSGAVLWSRTFPKEAPETLSRRAGGLLVFSWPANSEGAKLEIRGNPALNQRWPKVDADSSDFFLEVLDPRSGKTLGAAMLRTGKGSFQVTSAEASGNFLVAADSSNRLHVISLESGEQKGVLFGRRPALSMVSPLLAAENERGQLSLYDLNSLGRREQYVFTKSIAYVDFAADNQRMLVLTGDQTVYFLTLPKDQNSATVH